MHRCLSGDGLLSHSGESFGMYTLSSLRLMSSNGIGLSFRREQYSPDLAEALFKSLLSVAMRLD